MNALLQVGNWRAWTFGELAVALVVIAAVAALVYVALRQLDVAVPEWVKQVCWIVAVAFVVILAIRLVLAM